MTPFELTILIHYYGSVNDFRDGDFSAPILEHVFKAMIVSGLLAVGEETKYRITEKGWAFVEALCNTPLPVQKWVMP